MQSPSAVARLMRIAKASARREDGQDLLEYGLLAALIAVVAVGAITSMGQTLYNVFWNTIANNF
jgi:pilus assembly protein Flp/PilA